MNDTNKIILKIKDLEVLYATRMGLVKAVDKVDLELKRGQTLGLVGESGCGKSTLGFSILRLIPPPGRIIGGEIIFDSADLVKKTEKEMRNIRGKRISMIFQDPMTCLNPLMRIGDHIVETILTHEKKLNKKDAIKIAEDLVVKLGISKLRLDDYPHQFSGGMRQRAMISLALALNSDLIIADEPTTSLDVIVEAQILDLLKELRSSYKLTIILITHNMGVVSELVDRIAIMYAGKIVEIADCFPLFEKPLHPYTVGLLKSIPNISLEKQELEIMPGSPPDLINLPTGCRFHPRCKNVMKKCSLYEPPLKEVKENHLVRCWLY
ncbi:MAG: ABC transporter ATP-binding protein [Actinomycetia bacterium]|nr:ABC transporter ATP-binding protein [Actinomycetes bacterium]